MKQISVNRCKNGDILADDVYNEKGVLVIVKDTMMNEYIKSILWNHGVNEVKIYSSNKNRKYLLFEKQYKECVIQIKDLLKHITLGDYKEVKNITLSISDEIYKNVLENDIVIHGLHKIQNIDEYTYTHCINVAFYSVLMGKWINMPEDKIYELICASILHDIGKTKIPLTILNKKGKLDSNEFETVKTHTNLGYDMIKNIPDFNDDVKEAILMHHERIDGTGYPNGLKEDSISLYAKIIAIADVYDAMTQNRIYKNKVSPFDSFEMFLTEGYRLFDYPILCEFLRNMTPLLIGNNVQLSNGEIGEIIFIPPHDITNPILSINSKYIDLSINTGVKVLQVV